MSDDNLNSGLNGNMRDFFADDENEGKDNHPLGVLGTLLLHGVALGLAAYSAYHGIHATAAYRASQGLGNASGIVGILVNEATVIGTYLAFFYSQITGKVQQYIAATTLAVGVVIMALGIVGDSQLQAGIEMSSWLQTYLTWILPVSPVIMAILAGLTLATDPRVLRRIKAAFNRNKAAEKRHTARMKAEDAKLQVAQSAANLQLNTLQMTAEYAHAAYRAPEVQQAIQAAALANLPELLRGAGVMLPYGTVIEGQAIDPTAAPPRNTTEDVTPRPSRWNPFARRPPAAQTTPQAAPQDQPDADAITAAIAAMVARGELVIPVTQPGISTHNATNATNAAPGQGNGPTAKPLGDKPADFR